jgi:hypothetical protein
MQFQDRKHPFGNIHKYLFGFFPLKAFCAQINIEVFFFIGLNREFWDEWEFWDVV